MSPFLKWFLLIFAGLIVSLGGALAYVAATFDPNDYKDQITAEVGKATGRQLTLGGPIELTLFPWLGARVQQVSLSNAQGFGDEPFAVLEQIDVRLRLLPLLKGQVKLGVIVIRGLRANPTRKADGSTNWDDLVEKGKSEDPAEADSAGDMPDLSVAGVEILGARIVWRDGAELTELRDMNLEIGEIAENADSTIDFSAAVSLPNALEIVASLKSGLRFGLEGPTAQLSGLTSEITARGPTIPAGEQRLKLAADIEYVGAQQSARISNIELTAAAVELVGAISASKLDQGGVVEIDLKAAKIDPRAISKALAVELSPAMQKADWPDGSMSLNGVFDAAKDSLRDARLEATLGDLQLTAKILINQLLSAPAGTVDINLAPLDLRAFLTRFGMKFPEIAGGGPTQLTSRIQLSPDKLDIPKLAGKFDGADLNGSLSVANLGAAAPALRMDLALQKFDADRWMPESEDDGSKSAGGGGGSIDQMELPMDWAKDLNVTARAEIKELRAYRLLFRNVLWTADGRPGQPVKQRFGMTAYGGEITANNQIDATGAEPKLGLSLAAKAIALGDFLQDGWGSKWLTGTTTLNLDVASRGSTVGALRKALNGEASYRLQDGEAQGLSLLDIVRGASAQLQGPKSTAADSGKTEFAELVGRMLIQNGRLNIGELAGNNPWLKFGGDGWIDLAQENLNLVLKPQVLKNERTASEPALAHLAGLIVPIKLTGNWGSPNVALDLESMVKDRAKAELNRQVDKEKDKLEDKLQDKLGDLFKPKPKKAPAEPAPAQ